MLYFPVLIHTISHLANPKFGALLDMQKVPQLRE